MGGNSLACDSQPRSRQWVDQTAAAASAGLALRPTVLVIFGNPAAGTGLMQSVPHMALALPLQVLTLRKDGQVVKAKKYVCWTDLGGLVRGDLSLP